MPKNASIKHGHNFLTTIIFMVGLLCFPVCGFSNEIATLIQYIESNEFPFRPISKSSFEQSKTELENALTRVESILNRQPPQIAKGWMEYVNVEGIKAELAKDSPSRPVLLRTITRLTRNQEILSQPAFLSLRESTRTYLSRSRYYKRANAEKVHVQLITSITKLLKEKNESPESAKDSLLGQLVGALKETEQSPELLRKIQETFSQPNLVLRMSGEFIEKAGSIDVENVTPINETILGTKQIGQAVTDGKLVVKLQPNPKQAQFAIRLHGVTNSRTKGTREVPIFGEIEIYNTGHTRVLADANLFLDSQSLSATVARAHCEHKTHIDGVCSPTLIRQIAKKEIHKRTDEANIIAAQRSELRLREQTDKQIAKITTNTNLRLQKLNDFLARTDNVPRRFDVYTTAEELCIEIADFGRKQIGNHTSRPKVSFSNDLTLQIHKSAINNFFERELSNLFVSSEQLNRIAPELVKEDADKLEIKFGRNRPLEVEMENDRLTLTVQLRELSRNGTKSPNPFSVTAIYEVQESKRLVRKEPIKFEFQYSKPRNETIRETGYRENALSQFEAQFPKTLDLAEVAIPERIKNLGEFWIENVTARDGWLNVGIDATVKKIPLK